MNTQKLLILPMLLGLAACGTKEAPPPAAPQVTPPPSVETPEPSPPSQPTALAQPTKETTPVAESPAKPELRPLDIPFRKLVESLSERDAYYFSHNYVSNETAYLQTAPQLPKVVKPGGAFIGVGPEQNFSYIALTRPDVAFVVDIRRRNMLLHLLYKAIFKEATSRSHFLATLLGRPYEAEGDPGENATIEQVMAHATKLPKSKERFDALHNQLRQRITDEYGFKLVYTDRAAIKSAHREFYDKQLDIHFELHVKSKRDYPTLQTLLTVADPSGSQTGFLASEKSFRLIQKMQEQDRIIPVVGDFGGDKALPGIARFFDENDIVLHTFYVSNVEEYLLQDNKWDKWIRNVAAFQIDNDSVFIRSYLARAGRVHPLQLEGHWSTSFLQHIKDFRERQDQSAFRTWHDVATHAVLAP